MTGSRSIWDRLPRGHPPEVLTCLEPPRNHEGAGKKVGFTRRFENEDPGNRILTLKPVKDGGEVWVKLEAGGGEGYQLVLVEKGALKEEVTANALLEALNRDGHVALYINFDTGKATLRPDSAKVLDEVYALLSGNAGLKLRVEGHTDNVGDAKANQKLSETRAKSAWTGW